MRATAPSAGTAGHPPAPVEADGPRFGLYHLLKLRRHPISHQARLREKYGDVMKIRVFGVTVHATSGPDLAEEILLNRERIFANGPAWSHFIGPFFRRGIMLLDFDEHLHHRRILQHAFTADALRRYHGVMAPHIHAGVADWGEIEEPHLQRLFKQLTLDLALETFVGVDLPAGERDRINAAFIDAVRAGTSVVRRPVPGTPWARGLKARRVLEDFFREHLPAKRRDGGDDLFAQLCVARSEDGDEFTDDDIVNHMIFLLMAAHDTSTTTLTSMAYHLARHPEWQEAAREEARSLGTPVGEDPSYDDIVGLDLLDRIMKESMRLCAPVPTMPRVATRETTLAGRRIPAGGFVTVSPFSNHQAEDAWRDASTFDPDRFSPGRREDRSHRMAFHVFGGGVHKCIGMHFAGMQVRAIFHEVLRRYRWSVPEGYTWPLDLAALPVVSDGLPVRLERIDP